MTALKTLCVHAKSLQSCLILCDPMDCSPPGSSVHGILQVRILEWVAMPSSRGSSQPRGGTQVSCIAGGFYHLSHQGSPFYSGQQCREDLIKQTKHVEASLRLEETALLIV